MCLEVAYGERMQLGEDALANDRRNIRHPALQEQKPHHEHRQGQDEVP